MSRDTTDLDLTRRLVAFFPQWGRWMRANLPDDADLTASRTRMLGALVEAKEPLPMTVLSQHLCMTKRNVTALVDRLEQEALVQRIAHPTDRRSTLIQLSTQGQQVAPQLVAEHQRAVARAFATLSAEERHQLERILDKIEAFLTEHNPR